MTHKISLFSLILIVTTLCNTSCNRHRIQLQPLYEIEENGLYGFIDSLGNKKIDTKYLSVSEFYDNGLAMVIVDTIYKNTYGIAFTDNKNIKSRFFYIKYGYINQEGDFVIKPNLIRKIKVNDSIFYDGKSMFDEITSLTSFSFNDGLAGYQDTLTNLYGFIDTLGNIKIEPQYNEIRSFCEGRAPVCKYNKNSEFSSEDYLWGFIDINNKPITDIKYKKLSWMHTGRAFGYYEAKEYEDSSGYYSLELVDFLDANGHVIRNDLYPTFFYYGFTNDSLCLGEHIYEPVMPDGTPIKGIVHYGNFVFIKRDGNRLEPYKKEMPDNSLGYLNLEECSIEDMTDMHNGFAGVCLTMDSGEKYWLFIDKNLWVIKPINGWEYYEGIIPFNQGLAAIKHDGKWGYVNSKFDIVVPLKYDSCEIARKGLLKVYLMKRNAITVESYITRNDSIVWQRVKDKNETINNIYSKKEKMKYGTWIYKYEDTKWTRHMLIIIIIVGCLFFIVFKTHKRNNFIDSIKTNKKEIKL